MYPHTHTNKAYKHTSIGIPAGIKSSRIESHNLLKASCIHVTIHATIYIYIYTYTHICTYICTHTHT